MTSKIGIWLDRSRAIIVRINDKKCDTLTLLSEIGDARHPRCGTEGHCTIIPERRLRERKQELARKFYKKIIGAIMDAGPILIMGPGMAKTELLKSITGIKSLRSSIIGIKTAEKMSNRQIESIVMSFFNSFVTRSSMQTQSV